MAYNKDELEDMHRKKEEQQVEFLLEFLSHTKNYCVCIVDIVGSTQTVMNLSSEKISMYYSIFLNRMARIVKSFGAVIVKNIGDSLLYYFPNTEAGEEAYFRNVFSCCLTMIDKRDEVNMHMRMEDLPDVNYRISSEYGFVVIAKTLTSSVDDIFGPTVNICSKINAIAKPNTFVIGQELYNRTKSFREYIFTEIKDRMLNDYTVYLVSKSITS